MKNNRIPQASLQPRYLDGMILYAADINEIISILVAGVNQNKFDMDKILMGSSNSVVVYKEEALDSIPANEGDYATLFRYGDEESVEGDTLSLYRYDGDNWKYLKDLSLIDMMTDIEDILVEIANIKESIDDSVNERIDSVNERIDSVDERIDSVEDNLTQLDEKVDSVEDNLTQLDGEVDNLRDYVIRVESDVNSISGSKQDKLVAGKNITIDPDTNVISSIGGTGTVISVSEPTDSDIEMWVKLTGEEIIL